MKFRNLLFLFSLSPFNGQAQNFEGYYVLEDEQACQFPINITLQVQSFAIFEQISQGQEKNKLRLIDEGEVSVIHDEDNTYLKMNQIEGLYKDDVVKNTSIL